MTTSHPLFGTTISSYTRAQAIEDGALIDITDQAMRSPMLQRIGSSVAVERDAWARIHRFDRHECRGVAIGFALGWAIQGCPTDEAGGSTVTFGFEAWDPDTDEEDEFQLVARCHAGDRGERVFTIALA